MNKIAIGFVSILAVLGITYPVYAAPTFMAEQDKTLTIDKAINDDAYIAGDTVTISQKVSGDLYVAGNDITINADVAGDVIAAGNTITIHGNVGDDVRAAGAQVSIYGKVGDDVLVTAGTLTLGADANIGGDLRLAAENGDLAGRIAGSLKAFGHKISMQTVVGGDASLRADDSLSVLSGTKIAGNLDYWTPTEDTSLGQYAKTVTYHKLATSDSGIWNNWRQAAGWSSLLWSLLAMLILGLITIAFFPKFLPKAVVPMKEKFWRMAWNGLLFAVVVPLIGIVLLTTLIGYVAALVIGLTYLLIMTFGGLTAMVWIGQFIIRDHKGWSQQFAAFALGALILAIIGEIPIIGWAVKIVIVLAGVGATLTECWQGVKSYR